MSTALPDTMRAAQRIRAGRLEAAIQVSSDVPLPRNTSNLPDEHVLVKVHFTALNPIDLKFSENPVISKLLKTTIPCLDFAGIVVSSRSSHFTTGETIFGQTQPPNFGACAGICCGGSSALREGSRRSEPPRCRHYRHRRIDGIPVHCALRQSQRSSIHQRWQWWRWHLRNSDH